jgi:predicted metal-dependent hydrolase
MLTHAAIMWRIMSELPIEIRRSRRARRLSARVHLDGRVEVVVPIYAPGVIVDDFIARHRSWMDARRAERLRQWAAEPFPPPHLDLKAFGERWSITRIVSETSRMFWQETSDRELQLHLPEGASRMQSRVLLIEWLRRYLRPHFERRLSALADGHGFHYESMQLRRQRTRWGSCSKRGVISLNLCGAFQPPEVLDYLMLHELVHTRHMNHSDRYWRAVEAVSPKWRELDRALTHGWQFVPQWVFR